MYSIISTATHRWVSSLLNSGTAPITQPAQPDVRPHIVRHLQPPRKLGLQAHATTPSCLLLVSLTFIFFKHLTRTLSYIFYDIALYLRPAGDIIVWICRYLINIFLIRRTSFSFLVIFYRILISFYKRRLIFRISKIFFPDLRNIFGQELDYCVELTNWIVINK